eukprot:Hpha_TRINITY_DN16058_c3_g2::TRINITY_DN16058_c3_g2_i10::g.120751::m.120751
MACEPFEQLRDTGSAPAAPPWGPVPVGAVVCIVSRPPGGGEGACGIVQALKKDGTIRGQVVEVSVSIRDLEVSEALSIVWLASFEAEEGVRQCLAELGHEDVRAYLVPFSENSVNEPPELAEPMQDFWCPVCEIEVRGPDELSQLRRVHVSGSRHLRCLRIGPPSQRGGARPKGEALIEALRTFTISAANSHEAVLAFPDDLELVQGNDGSHIASKKTYCCWPTTSWKSAVLYVLRLRSICSRYYFERRCFTGSSCTLIHDTGGRSRHTESGEQTVLKSPQTVAVGAKTASEPGRPARSVAVPPPYVADAKPVGMQPVAQPVVAQPVVAQPVVAQPVVAQPVVAQQVVAQPVVAQPVVMLSSNAISPLSAPMPVPGRAPMANAPMAFPAVPVVPIPQQFVSQGLPQWRSSNSVTPAAPVVFVHSGSTP